MAESVTTTVPSSVAVPAAKSAPAAKPAVKPTPVAAKPPAAAPAASKPTTPAPAAKPGSLTAAVANADPVKAEDASAKPAEPVKPAAPEMFEVTVNGQKRMLTKEQAIRQMQKDMAGDQRLREAHELTKRNQTLLELLKDPERVVEALAELGHDVDALAQKRLVAKAEDALLTPEEREKRDMLKKIADYEAREKKREAETKTSEQKRRDDAVFATLEKEYIAAAERAQLEATPDNLLRIAEIGSEFLDVGLELTPDQIVAEIKDREDTALLKLEKQALTGLTGEPLLKRLGADTVKAVVQAVSARYHAQPAYQAPEPEAEKKPRAPRAPKGPAYYSEREYLESLRAK